MNIRPFLPEDAPAVASLWQYWFRGKTRTPDPGLTELVQRLYVEQPGVDQDVTPLVAHDEDGRMLGFLGATVAPVVVDGRPGKLAGLFPPLVDPDLAPTTVASFLLRKFLAGSQDLTMSDGGHPKFERIWETLGGMIAPIQSLRWVKLFRPAQVAQEALSGRSWVKGLRPLISPFAVGSDWLARRAVPGRLTAKGSALQAETLSPESLTEANRSLHAKARLRVDYQAESLRWQFEEMARIREQGDLQTVLLRDQKDSLAGWYVYHLNPGGTSRVYMLSGSDRHLDGVIDHLFHHADQRGAAALMGRLEPRLRRPMTDRGTLIHGGGSLQMIHAKDPTLMQDAVLGRLAFSRLEGENWYWWSIISAHVPRVDQPGTSR